MQFPKTTDGHTSSWTATHITVTWGAMGMTVIRHTHERQIEFLR